MLSVKEWPSLRKVNAQNQLTFMKNARQQNENVVAMEIF